MSAFKDLAASARETHAAYFSDTVTLLVDGNESTPKAVLGKVKTETRVNESGRRTRVTVRMCRFPELTTIRHDAVISADGFNWSIEEVLDRTASGLSVQLQRVSVHENTRESYRGRP